jgi:hypothetical protein
MWCGGFIIVCQAEPPSTLHPMKDFDPSEPAILHDRISGAIIAGAAKTPLPSAVRVFRARMEPWRGMSSCLMAGATCSVANADGEHAFRSPNG